MQKNSKSEENTRRLQEIKALCAANNIRVINPKTFPHSLQHTKPPPQNLYCKGKLAYSYEKSIAIIGSRNPTTTQLKHTEFFTKYLAEQGFTIISGLAYGVDSHAHQIALDSAAKCIAVIGSGHQNIYPREHKNLAEQIYLNGCILSEYPPDTPPQKHHFIHRNRLIAGLASSVLVICSTEKSGSLITAHSAFEQNKNIYTLPNEIDLSSQVTSGNNKLIKENLAKLVTHPSDILLDLGITPLKQELSKKLILSPEESYVFDQIKLDIRFEQFFDQFQEKFSKNVLPTLSLLELKGLIFKTELGEWKGIKPP